MSAFGTAKHGQALSREMFGRSIRIELLGIADRLIIPLLVDNRSSGRPILYSN